METSVIDFLRENQVIKEDLLDSLQYELNKHFYFYGDHFKKPLAKRGKEIGRAHV